MASDFVLNQTSIDLQNDLNKIERMMEVRSLGDGLRLDPNIRQLSALVTTEDNSADPFEIADDGGHVVLRVTNDGHIQTKEFNSENINILPQTIKDRYLHTNAITGAYEWIEIQQGSIDFQVLPTLPQATTVSPKVVYSLADNRLYILSTEDTPSSSAVLGQAILGQMILGVS